MAISSFPGKIPVTRKIFFNFLYPSPNVAPKANDQSSSISIFRALPFHFRPTLNIKGSLMLREVHIRKKKRSNKHGILQTWSIVSVAMLPAVETAVKVLLSVVINPLLIEINFSQIRTLDIKREKVCEVCPYLLLLLCNYVSLSLQI